MKIIEKAGIAKVIDDQVADWLETADGLATRRKGWGEGQEVQAAEDASQEGTLRKCADVLKHLKGQILED